MIKFGPSGLGPLKDAIQNLQHYHDLGLRACEIAFTYGIYIKDKSDAEKIGAEAKKLGIDLSIHAPYWINLNSAEKIKIEQSKKRILDCCKVGTWLGATRIVFHAGFYGKFSKEQTYENIKKQILEMQKEIKKNSYTSILAPEIMGKINVFGSIEEIFSLVEQTGCDFCIDFAHILARYKNYNFEKVFELSKSHKNLHIHFSGIEYSDKGERHHKLTSEKEIRELLENLPKNKNFAIINESPNPVGDSVKTLKLYQ